MRQESAEVCVGGDEDASLAPCSIKHYLVVGSLKLIVSDVYRIVPGFAQRGSERR